jgi:hypothetical protein
MSKGLVILRSSRLQHLAVRLPQREVHDHLEVRRSQTPHTAPESATEVWERVAANRLELTERTESSLREERDRLLADLEREKEERRKLQEQIDRTRRSWWRRFFGIE